MKAFGFAVAFVILMAVVTGAVLEGMLSRESDEAFATQNVRVGEGPSIEHRNFSGRGR